MHFQLVLLCHSILQIVSNNLHTVFDQEILGLGLPLPEHLKVMSLPFRVTMWPSLGMA